MQRMKEEIAGATLAVPEADHTLTLETDASGIAIGSVL